MVTQTWNGVENTFETETNRREFTDTYTFQVSCEMESYEQVQARLLERKYLIPKG